MKYRKFETHRLIRQLINPDMIMLDGGPMYIYFENYHPILVYNSKIEMRSSKGDTIGKIMLKTRTFRWITRDFVQKDAESAAFYLTFVDKLEILQKSGNWIMTHDWAETLHSVLLILWVWREHPLFCRFDRNIIKKIMKMSLK